MTTWINYAETGYDERDGLLGGRWMFDDERRCQVWVEIKAAGSCECGRPKGPRAARCDSCMQRMRRQRRAAEQVAA